MEKTLRYIATQWPMHDYPTAKKPWSPERLLAEIQKAGFDGFTARAQSKTLHLASKAGMTIVGNVDIGNKAEVRKKLTEFRDLGALYINIQLCDHDTPTEKALPIAMHVMEEGAKLGLRPQIEFHRDTCTETPEKGYALAAAYKKATGEIMPMNFDYSHLAIIKQLNYTVFSKRLLEPKGREILAPSPMLHLRPFNGSHCQIPITDGRGGLSLEFKQWLPFCEDALTVWYKDKNWDSYRVVVPEQGPVGSGYGLSCFPDVWEDIVVLNNEIKKVWKRISSKGKTTKAKAKR
ncbi:MAG: xylose isomerase [Chthoniobacterales bacterium]